jgi:hypothetical protein
VKWGEAAVVRVGRRTRNRLVAGLLCLAVVVGGWWLLFAPRYSVTVPPANASPAQVATAYMRALDGFDSGTADALSTPNHRHEAALWLSNTASVRDRTVLKIHPVTGGDWKRPGEPYTEAVQVEVQFTYQQHWWSDDASVPNGSMLWGYFLVRDKGGRWLVSDEGVA